jgi:ABC-type multidrug transport system fused ATPase/permease subunit
VYLYTGWVQVYTECMDSLIKSDIFFVITTFIVVVVGGLIALVLVYLVRILADVKKLSQKVREEGERMVLDIEGLRENIKKNTIKLSDILSFGLFRKSRVRKHNITHNK